MRAWQVLRGCNEGQHAASLPVTHGIGQNSATHRAEHALQS
eukprot:CAMPEP_0115148044 /NCGR_PEP_ID=MMETSP0227-20121206/63650_1 /TAXON_ID=89957 /ORGANISM="Polarella glacialis, Strain CCMP 1383" /LENGTH=40 /DNA_ID= /DNA_START= /DNA_END= /DNA_ORIENTATION=